MTQNDQEASQPRPPEGPRRIIITGASSGIGQAIAHRLSAPEVTIVNLDITTGEASAAGCSGPFHTILADMAKPAEIATAFQQADKVFTGEAPDLLVCCAALSKAAPFLDVSLEELDRLLAVNVRGTFVCCQQAGARMVARRAGRIVVITSLCAAQGWARESVYCITKGAQQSLVQSIAVELAPFGVLVNAVAPGLIQATGDSMAKTRGDPEVYRHDMERTPLGRFGTVNEVAEAVYYLATVTWTTGQTLFLDGGFMATGLGYIGETRKALLAGRHPSDNTGTSEE